MWFHINHQRGCRAMIDPELLKILVCPENKTPVTEADDALVARINEAIAGKRLTNRKGGAIEEAVEGALVREDKAYAYPVRDDIPIMLIDEAIPLGQLEGAAADSGG